jgi:type VI secretion system secreted protein Hcp
MALNAYLRLAGQTHGEIDGGVTQKGREKSILVFAVWHEIVGPRDPASGRTTGKRHHKAIVISKEVDRSSPLLYSLLVHSELIPTWKLQFWRPSPTGQEQQHFTIELVNATVSSIQMRMANNRNPRLMKYPEYEEVGFTYQVIRWTWNDGGISAEDDWETPRA